MQSSSAYPIDSHTLRCSLIAQPGNACMRRPQLPQVVVIDPRLVARTYAWYIPFTVRRVTLLCALSAGGAQNSDKLESR